MTAEFFVGAPIVIRLPGIAQPELSPVGNGYIYFDQASGQFKVSQNGGVYVDLVGGGGSLPPLIGIQYAALMENPIGVVSWNQITEDMILPAYSVDLSAVGSTSVEVGSLVNNPQFNASYVRPAAAATLSDNQGNPPQDVLADPNPLTMPFAYTKATNNDTVVFTLSANETGGPTRSDNVTMTWQPRVYWGTGAPGQSSEAFIESLTGNALAGGRGRTFTVNAGVGEAIYYAYPLAYGNGTFSVNGFVGGFNPPTTVSVTNAFGVTQDYLLYESALTGLGSTTVVVS